MRLFFSAALRSPCWPVVLRTIAVLAALLAPVATYGQTKVYVVNSGSTDLSVIDTSLNQVMLTLPGPSALTPIGYNSLSGLLYVPTHESAGKLFVLDPVTNSFQSNPVGLGAFPIYITVSPELSRAYVSNFFGGVTPVNTATGSAFDPQLSKVYVINNQTADLAVLDPNTNQVTVTVPFALSQPQDVKIDTALHKAFASNTSSSEVTVFNVNTNAVTNRIPIPLPPQVAGKSRPQFLAIDSDTHRAYVTYNNGVSQRGMIGGLAVLNTTNDQVITSFTLGNNPTRLALSPLEGRLYVTDSFRNRLIVLSTANNSVITEIPVGTTPVDLAVVPPPAPILSASAANLAFGDQTVGTASAAQTIQVRNVGNRTLVIQSIFVTTTSPPVPPPSSLALTIQSAPVPVPVPIPNGTPFKLQANTCAGATLPAGATCNVSVTFAPKSAGPFASTLTITSNDGRSPKLLPLTGTGVIQTGGNSRAVTPLVDQAVPAIRIKG